MHPERWLMYPVHAVQVQESISQSYHMDRIQELSCNNIAKIAMCIAGHMDPALSGGRWKLSGKCMHRGSMVTFWQALCHLKQCCFVVVLLGASAAVAAA